MSSVDLTGSHSTRQYIQFQASQISDDLVIPYIIIVFFFSPLIVIYGIKACGLSRE